MSDPVSNAEIEDVLSSIRRLVSVDKPSVSKDASPDRAAEAEKATDHSLQNHGLPDDAAPVKPDQAAPKGDARLVLTPSFRVEPEDQKDDADSAEHDVKAPEDQDPQHLTLGQWQVDPEDAEAGALEQSDEGAPDDDHETTQPEALSDLLPEESEESPQGDDAQLKEWLTAEGDMAASPDTWQDENESPGDGPEDLSDEDDDFEAATFAEDEDVAFEYAAPGEAGVAAEGEWSGRETVGSELEARIAEVEAAVAARDDQWEPDGASEDAYAGGRTEPLPWEDHLEATVPVFTSRLTQKESADAARDAGEPDADMTFAEPDMPSGQTSRPEPEAEKDEGQASHARKSGIVEAENAGNDNSWYREDTDAVLDEDALRDLVSEIVRQELQGTLGERITRNVRKLVRREIHRAMMGQDLD
ncbi:hypothetical protein PVV74_05190 [Roseovarius sp. SK2]|uniref:hypothetical protein n=1 Tax=Roseovarius TaxID=74030 RepID=UPI00237A27E2|nr:hypothetical protein [Roseovarius sp. SK2]MDD9724842.1 hypothetical protein [Roseovarius sp. SK2]